MADLGGFYSAEGGATMGDRSALPAGEYVAAMVKSDRKETKTGDGAYINCEFQVMGGADDGRRFWTMLNLWNRNAQAVEIAQRELNSIMHACGKLSVSDTIELHGIPMRVTLGIKSDSYGEKNIVKKYAPMNEAPGAAATAAPATKTPPWGARKAG